jgi:hypothetical protein
LGEYAPWVESRSSGNDREDKNLARNASKLKLSYYPLAEREGMRIRRFLQFAGAASVLDPCAGTGAALRTITDGAEARRYGIELDAIVPPRQRRSSTK